MSENQDQYVFTMRAVQRRDDPYFYTNWDGARNYEVVAASREEAFEKLWALLGPVETHRQWTAKVMGARDVRIPTEATR